MTRTFLHSNHSTALFDEDSYADNNDLAGKENLNQEPIILEISFWEINPKEHLWSRLKSLELFEIANVFIMVYNADDRDSFEKVQLIH